MCLQMRIFSPRADLASFQAADVSHSSQQMTSTRVVGKGKGTQIVPNLNYGSWAKPRVFPQSWMVATPFQQKIRLGEC